MKYDLHNHTYYSRCSNLKPELLLKLANKKGLDGIAVTDHNTIRGAVKAKKLNDGRNFEVIIGEEITTDAGEVLAFYLKDEVKPGNFFDVIDSLRKQNAVVSIAHPFRASLSMNKRFKYGIESVKNKIDAIEVFNARNLPGNNELAQKTAKRLNLAGTAGSDAHFAFEVCSAYTIFDGELRDAIKRKRTSYKGSILYGPFGGFASFLRKRLAGMQK